MQTSRSGEGAVPRGRASADKATASSRARRPTTGARPAREAPAPVPFAEPVYSGGGILDADARHDIAGVVLAVIGVALLVAVAVPTSGVLTQAVSTGLHTLLGLGAFLFPVALIVWALSFFVHIPKIVPGRVAIGLTLIALAAISLVGILTPGAESDPSRLFNAYVLSDRGGYVGNGIAWVLLTLTGRTVGIIALAGVAVAGCIVIGLNVTDAVETLSLRSQQRRAVRRMRSEERAAMRSARAQSAARMRDAREDFPEDYAPTALFDPARPLSRASGDLETAVLDDRYGADPSAEGVARGSDAEMRSLHFGCGTSPLGAEVHDPVDAEGTDGSRAERDRRHGEQGSRRGSGDVATAADETRVLDGRSSEASRLTTLLERQGEVPEPESRSEATGGVRNDVAGVPAGEGAAWRFGEGPSISEDSMHAVERDGSRRAQRRPRHAAHWWDEADDWDREDFDPGEAAVRAPSAYVPGVLPGAPLALRADGPEDATDGHRELLGSASGSARNDTAPMERGPIAGLGEVPTEPAEGNGAHCPAEPFAADRMQTAPSEVQAAADPRRDAARSRVSALTHDMLASQEDGPCVAARNARGAAAVATGSAGRGREADEADVDLPWTPAHVNAGAPRVATCRTPDDAAREFVLPDPNIMQRSKGGIEHTPEQRREAEAMGARLQSTLAEFGVKAEVVDWVEGPTCTTYEVNPGEGVRVNRFTNLEDDIARALARTGVRIYAPVPGTSYVGIEVPNTTRQVVYFGDVLPYLDGGPLDFAVGLDANGRPVHCDLAKLPHLLVAGTTGSGKSVAVNAMVMSMLMRDTPDEVRLIMIDPKQVEFKDYNDIPHLIMPVVTDMRQAAAALQWGVTEMDRRYRVFSEIGVRDLKGYNRLAQPDDGEGDGLQTLPSIVIVIDELADLMMVAKKDVEASIVRIAQLGRACGIHLIMATQSPRADVVTGLIRANVACRIGLKVAKGTDSKIVIDQMGAEKLLGNGDMLFLQTAWGDRPRRIQGCWLSDEEISKVVSHLKGQARPEYNCQMAPLPGTQVVVDFTSELPGPAGSTSSAGSDDDPLAWKAAELVVESQMGSTSMIQRRLKLGYARAGRVMDMLEEMGVVGPAQGSKPRDVLIRDLDELATLHGGSDDMEGGY